MKKLFLLIIVTITAAIMLFSCEWIGGSQVGDDNVIPDNGNHSVGSVIWSSDVKATIVVAEETTDISSLYQHIFQKSGISPDINPIYSAETSNEIIFGRTGRQISDAAYAKLDRYADLYTLEQDGDSAYLIYAEGDCIAIAYSDTFARYAAVEYLIANSEDGSFTADGVVKKDIFNTVEFIAEKRNTEREIGFAKAEEELGEEATDALRLVYSLYDEKLYYLLANLYDPAVGGFYYSVSARDNFGYLPDIESTMQALNLIDNANLSAGSLGVNAGSYGTYYWPNYLSDEMNEQLYAFALSLKADDGYYYHPQWGTDISSSRKGRDQGWGNRLLATLDAKADGNVSVSGVSYVVPSSSHLTGRLLDSTTDTVSKIVPDTVTKASSSFEASLSSEADFAAWLDSGLSKNSYSVGNTISSNISAIKKAGLFDFLREYLTEHQFENGLWEQETSYNAINGLMKLCTVFGGEHPFPNPKAAVESTIEVMTNDDLEVETICFVYNPWVALKTVIPFCSEEDRIDLKAYFVENAEMLILNTFDKLAVFKKDDGGFSMEPENSSQFSQMALVALPDQAESDVNATGIGVSTLIKYMIPVLGIEAPKLYCEYDSIYFLETLCNLQPVIKKTTNSKIEVVDFDLYDPADGEEANGVVLYPDLTVQTNIGNDTMDEDGYYKWLSTSVVPNPDPTADADDLVLRAIDYVYDYNKNGKFEDGKTPAEMAGTGSSVEFMMSNATSVGECYVFDADMYFNTASANNINDCLGQIVFQTAKGSNTHSAIMNIYAYKKDGKTYLRLAENWAGPDKVSDGEVVTGIPVDQWFNLRCETYKIYDGEGVLSIMMKFYLNGEYAGECDGGGYWFTSNGGYYRDTVISSVKFSLYRYSTSEWFFNNVSTYRCADTYVKEPLPPYLTPSDKEVYDFEQDSIVSNKYFEIVNYTKGESSEDVRNYIDVATPQIYNNGSFISIATDPKNAGNNVLKVFTNSISSPSMTSGVTLAPYIKNNEGQIYILDYDYYLEADSDITGTSILNYEILYGGKTDSSKVQAVLKPNVVAKLAFRPGNTKDTSLNLASGQWVKIRTVLDGSRKTLTIYVSIDNGATWHNYMSSDVVLQSEKISNVKIVFATAEAENRVQYLDNISFTLVDELYMTLTDGSEQTYGVPLAAVPSDTKVYDFNTDSIVSSDKNVNIFNALGSNDSIITSTDVATGVAGSFLSISVDPENAANKVLKIVSNENSDGSAATASFMTFNPYVQDEGGKFFVFDFDYYYEFEGDSAWGGIDYFDINYSDFTTVSEQAIFKSTLYDTDEDGIYEIVYRGGNISGDAGAAINTEGGRWVKIKAVIDDDANLLYIYQSVDGGNTWSSCRATPKDLNEAEIVSMSLRFTANIAINRVQYVDNISFVQVNGTSLNVEGQTVTFGK